ncbi:hypothetical protein TSUD_77900 [Trifolium subterraneum]|uniref:NAC domain-containing protein n=1 Tax=Trifolium subterraneum TaxID=3900 RepID=A0A2Z6NL97_TRISU|nr:hypothetical protein TSUD_77900 [Trifolium subterraneum]
MAVPNLCPGFRFHPTGVELMKYFLKRKVMGKKFRNKVIAELTYTNTLLGISQVFQKEGPGPRNGAQYGRPFNEEDWSDDEVGLPLAESAALVPRSAVTTTDSSVLNDQNLHASGYNGSISMPCQLESMPSPYPTNSCQTGLVPSLDAVTSCQTGLMPSPDPANSCQTALIPSPDPANLCQMGWMLPSSNPVNSCQTVLMPSLDPANSCQTGSVPSLDPANSCQTGSMPSPDPANSCQTGLMPVSDPANHSYPDNQAVNNDDILSMLDIFKDNDIFPEENIAEGALLGDFFEGLEDLDCSALGSFGQNSEFSTNGLATMGDVGRDDLDFVELTDLDSELFWQSTTPGGWSQNK